jgi:hypothetical protein
MLVPMIFVATVRIRDVVVWSALLTGKSNLAATDVPEVHDVVANWLV